MADLIYFPTGGGKTEAYLGLIAIVLSLRRIRGQGTPHEGRGVAVLLRYTLRLLTLDQLGRAATLICALEELRRRRPAELGNARFTIGLWVGASATANRLREATPSALGLHAGQNRLSVPAHELPVVRGADQDPEHQARRRVGQADEKELRSRRRLLRGSRCLYTETKARGLGLPVLFVDEQIYQEVPAFLVATVDKFAMMPWRGDAGMLFGRATHVDEQRAYGVMHEPPVGAKALPEGLLPPELVVQDELHLISGPLGTMVGLYEAAVDYLCERPFGGKAWPPKVICSTATVRRAREQIQALFGRPMALFPPRGITGVTASSRRSRRGRGVSTSALVLWPLSVRSQYARMPCCSQRRRSTSTPRATRNSRPTRTRRSSAATVCASSAACAASSRTRCPKPREGHQRTRSTGSDP